jgi:hypothetical protein
MAKSSPLMMRSAAAIKTHDRAARDRQFGVTSAAGSAPIVVVGLVLRQVQLHSKKLRVMDRNERNGFALQFANIASGAGKLIMTSY